MVYRGRGRVGGFFHMVFRGGWRGISRCKQSIHGEQKKIDGGIIIILQNLGVEGGENQNPLNPSPPPIQIVVINDDRSQGDNILDEEAITFSLLW